MSHTKSQFHNPPPVPLLSQSDVIAKLCTCGVSLAIYLSLCKLLPVDRSIDEEFVSATPFYLQVVYLYLAMLALRPKYYFVWTFGEYSTDAVILKKKGKKPNLPQNNNNVF